MTRLILLICKKKATHLTRANTRAMVAFSDGISLLISFGQHWLLTSLV